MSDLQQQFQQDGFIQVDDLLTLAEVEHLRGIYEDFLSGQIATETNRSDLGVHTDPKLTKTSERITQIMCPGRLYPALLTEVIYSKSLKIARELQGEDMALDFDMLIDKAPFSDTPTPWHQDCAYWIDMPDKRAVSCWVALDDVFVENGCMWFVPGSHLQPMRKHWQAAKGIGALCCKADELEAVAVPITKGSCTFHHGGTLHYSRGNSTNRRRRAFILNFRPQAMIQYERERGFDHTGNRTLRNQADS